MVKSDGQPCYVTLWGRPGPIDRGPGPIWDTAFSDGREMWMMNVEAGEMDRNISRRRCWDILGGSLQPCCCGCPWKSLTHTYIHPYSSYTAHTHKYTACLELCGMAVYDPQGNPDAVAHYQSAVRLPVTIWGFSLFCYCVVIQQRCCQSKAGTDPS